MTKLILKGIGASEGVVDGVARVYLPSEELNDFSSSDILVTTLTDPTMVVAMTKALAIVTDIGGITCHPAILSREMGIPCVVGTKEATVKIRSGMKIRVNGSTGEIYALD